VLVDFLKLIQNENMKIYRRVRTWIMFALVLLLPPVISVIFKVATNDHPTNWMVTMLETSIIMQLITIFTVVQASETVAGEFTWGTIKLLLIRPWSRSSILLSKFLSVILFALLLAATTFVVALLVNIALFGYSDSPTDMLPSMGPGGAAEGLGSPLVYMVKYYALEFVSLVMIVTFGFMMSSAFRSSGLAIGLSIFLLFSGSVITGLLALAHKAWVKYVLFMHLDLTSYLSGGQGPIPNHPTTLGFSLAVLAGYFIVFNLISWFVFNKRDVAA
jgi:ABC-2 type transport system permease protein